MFELGASPHPPREVYRAYLAQSQIFIGIYWQGYGWVPEGQATSGIEDEYRLSNRPGPNAGRGGPRGSPRRGKMISRDAPACELRDAASEVMAAASFRASAGRRARLIDREDGAASGASALQDWLPSAVSNQSSP